jgi:hypothetical protein
VGMEHVDVMRDGRESIVTSVPQGLMESIARLSAAASSRAAAMGGAWDTVNARATKGGRAAIAHIVTWV